MKKCIGLLICLLAVLVCAAALADIPIDAEHFPDPNFRSFINDNADFNKSGILEDNELQGIGGITCDGMVLVSVKGIEYFPNLYLLDCSSNTISELDISQNKELKELYCQENQIITEINFSNNPKLEIVDFHRNNIIRADFSNCPNLKELTCWSNQISSLNVEKNTKLTVIGCSDNSLTSLTLPDAPDLRYLDATSNKLTTLDVSKNPILINLVKSMDPTDYIHWDGGYSINWDGGSNYLAVDKPVTVKANGSTIVEPTEITEYKTNGVVYSLNNSKKTASVSGVTDKKAKELVIEDVLNIFDVKYKVIAINDNALKGLKKLTKLTIGKNVATIGANAMAGCKKLKNLIVNSTKLKKVGKNAAANLYKKVVIKCPAKKLAKYEKLFNAAGAPKNAKYTK